MAECLNCHEKMYAIVAFTKEDDSLGIIPTNWINYAQKFCLFPPVNTDKKKNFLITRRESSGSNWRQCPIRILKEYGDYDAARGHLTEAEETSNLDSDNGTVAEQRRRRKTKHIRLPGEDTSETGEDSDQPINQKINHKSYPAPPKGTNEAFRTHEDEVPPSSTTSVLSDCTYSSLQL
ncbi:hypothetical protein FQR65_LT15995 [Abscondita terminalis]|nr:hypothetical protein FQR65_LT15995 [Abscondita terminalis]